MPGGTGTRSAPAPRLTDGGKRTGKENSTPQKSHLLSGLALGGSNVRALEFALAAAQAQGADTVVAGGWAAQGKLNYVPVISDALPEDAWSGRTGFVHRAVMQDFPDLSGHQVYACGVPIMVDSPKKDFIASCKLPEDEFYADSFTTQADTSAAGAA